LPARYDDQDARSTGQRKGQSSDAAYQRQDMSCGQDDCTDPRRP
jgi:hypothetical protein